MKILKSLFLFSLIIFSGCATAPPNYFKDVRDQVVRSEFVVDQHGNVIKYIPRYHIIYELWENAPRPLTVIVKFQDPADLSRWLEKKFTVSESDPRIMEVFSPPLSCLDSLSFYKVIATIYKGSEIIQSREDIIGTPANGFGFVSTIGNVRECNPSSKQY